MGWLDRVLGRGPGPEVPPPPAPEGDPVQVAEAQTVIESLRPLLEADGGDLRLLAVEDGWVRVELRGACRTCSLSTTTIRGALEPRLRERCAWFRGVRAG